MKIVRWFVASSACLLAALVSVAAISAPKAEPKFVSLFDGKTLNGWHVIEGTSVVEDSPRWSVVDGAIVGQPVDGQNVADSWLASDKLYSNFVLRFKFRIEYGNSGFTYHSVIGRERVFAPEVDLESGIPHDNHTGWETGQIYVTDTLNGEWVNKFYHATLDPELVKSVYDTVGFNEMELQVRGTNVKVFLNGTKLTDFDHDSTKPDGRPTGFIAMELHSNTIGYWKDIEIYEYE